MTYIKNNVSFPIGAIAMKANPGGQIDVANVIGRDGVVQELWDTLQQQSVIMTAERRIGKTSTLRKMQAEPPSGWVPIYRDLENLHSSEEFAVSVFTDVKDHLTKWKRFTQQARRVFDWLPGLEAGGVKLPGADPNAWKQLVERSIQVLCDEQADNRLVFLWDEMPYMLDGIARREGEDQAMAVLDLLRALRHRHPTFRILLTGSIGLHHVLTKLRETGYTNSPVNDMHAIEVTPLAPADAQELAQRLIAGEQLESPDQAQAAEAVADAADHFPYYIHHIVKYLKSRQLHATPETVAECIQAQLLDANDPWELAHYRNRIDTYYPQNAKLVLYILDAIAINEQPVAIEPLLHGVKQQMEFDDRERLLSLLKLLERDHYLSRTTDGHTFRFPLIKRWWKLDRGL